MTQAYKDLVGYVERLHRRCLLLISDEMHRLGIWDVNAAQGMILFNIGERELPTGELIARGYYLGSSVSYNIKKLVENGYVVQTRPGYDRRLLNARSTERGRQVCGYINKLFERHASMLLEGMQTDDELTQVCLSLEKIEALWPTRSI